jgi:predicted dehydrogenase
MKMVNVAMVSMWHVHAEGYARFIKEQSDACVSAIWDDDVERGQKAAKEFGAAYEHDLDSLLDRADVDAVVVDAPTTEHLEVMLKAAKAGKHIFTEKALAPTVAECEKIAAQIKESAVQFCISFPGLTSGAIQYAKQAIDEGKLGQVTYLRIRAAHGGSSKNWLPAYWYDAAKTGGGAMMDLGCHPNYQASYLLGKPARITSMFNTVCRPGGLEDNAVSVVEFENKAIAVLETGFVTPHSNSAIEILGTLGSIYMEQGKVRIYSEPSGVEGWVVPDKLPKDRPVALRQWLDGILYGSEIAFDLCGAIALTELLENEYKAHHEQRVVRIG